MLSTITKMKIIHFVTLFLYYNRHIKINKKFIRKMYDIRV